MTSAPVVKWGFPANNPVEWQFSAVADVDGDRWPEVVFDSWDKHVYCLDGSTGSLEWSFKTDCYQVMSSPAVADVDGDGEMEVVVGSCDHKLYSLNGSTGLEEWSFTAGAKITASPAIADIDGNGVMEIFIGSDDRNVYCIDGSNGSARWTTSTSSIVHTPGALADVDGDDKLEFLVPQIENNLLLCLNTEDGSLLWQVALAIDVHSPFVGDIDKDGCVEVMVGTYETDANGNFFFALDDPANTFGCSPLNIEEDNSFPTLKPYPHGLYLFLPRASQVELLLYDATGRLVRTLYKGLLSQGAHTFPLKGLRRGVYTVVLESQGRVEKVIERVKVVR